MLEIRVFAVESDVAYSAVKLGSFKSRRPLMAVSFDLYVYSESDMNILFLMYARKNDTSCWVIPFRKNAGIFFIS